MKYILKLFVILSVISLFGCKKKGTYTTVYNAKSDFEVNFLFECDGVKVYRFYDGGRSRYFATNGTFLPTTQSSNGKSKSYWDDGAYTIGGR